MSRLPCTTSPAFFSCLSPLPPAFPRGAARIRTLFQKAQKQAPCIIFLDELDTLGKQRSLRLGGSNDEVEQTLNQLLACMDGLDSNQSGVIVIAATNRYEILDDALTR